jgi:hypothetical protein
MHGNQKQGALIGLVLFVDLSSPFGTTDELALTGNSQCCSPCFQNVRYCHQGYDANVSLAHVKFIL